MALEPPKATSCRPGVGGNPSKRADVWEPARVTFCKPEGRQTSLTTTKWVYPNDSQAAKYHFHCNFLPATHWLNSILITSCKDYWLILSLTVKEMVNWSIILSIMKLKKKWDSCEGIHCFALYKLRNNPQMSVPSQHNIFNTTIRYRFCCCSRLQLRCFPLQTHLSRGTWPMNLTFSCQLNTSYFWESWCLHVLFFPLDAAMHSW